MLFMCDFQDVRRCGGGPHLLRCTHRTWQPSDVQNLATEVWKFPWESENSRSPSGISTQNCVCGLTDRLSGECLSLSAAAEIPELTNCVAGDREGKRAVDGWYPLLCLLWDSAFLSWSLGTWAHVRFTDRQWVGPARNGGTRERGRACKDCVAQI